MPVGPHPFPVDADHLLAELVDPHLGPPVLRSFEQDRRTLPGPVERADAEDRTVLEVSADEERRGVAHEVGVVATTGSPRTTGTRFSAAADVLIRPPRPHPSSRRCP